MKPVSLRRRLFWTLFLAALVPAALTLVGGALLLREVVASVGSAGPWTAVAESGRVLLDLVRAGEPDPELTAAAEAHRAVLSESLRLSRVYALVGERVAVLIPLAGVLLLGFVAFIAAIATRRLAGSLAAPAEELADWIRRLGSGESLPPSGETEGEASTVRVAEFQQLRSGLQDASRRLSEARERELEQARMESWTEMARRVAHDIKNPLTPMRMAAERVSRAPDPASAEAGEVLLEEIARLDDLARAFSRFGRPVEGPPSSVDLAELAADVVRRLRVEGVHVALEAPSEPVMVLGHLEALERVVDNLVGNALEALASPEGNTYEGARGEPAVRVRLTTERAEAILVVEDRGPGISPEILDRIWEPDFTTRHRGTGLGLPLVRQTVRRHGGRVGAANRAGGGARFEVRLPLEEPAAETAPAPEMP